jgi:hypothetical protein
MTAVFVFGSNLAGRHGAGAALYARKYFGARYGQGAGLQGNSYAIPTKDKALGILSLAEIRLYVRQFISFAAHNPDMKFNVTRIGCGLAGYTDADIAPMFNNVPPNVTLPQSFREVLDAVG